MDLSRNFSIYILESSSFLFTLANIGIVFRNILDISRNFSQYILDCLSYLFTLANMANVFWNFLDISRNITKYILCRLYVVAFQPGKYGKGFPEFSWIYQRTFPNIFRLYDVAFQPGKYGKGFPETSWYIKELCHICSGLNSWGPLYPPPHSWGRWLYSGPVEELLHVCLATLLRVLQSLLHLHKIKQIFKKWHYYSTLLQRTAEQQGWAPRSFPFRMFCSFPF